LYLLWLFFTAWYSTVGYGTHWRFANAWYGTARLGTTHFVALFHYMVRF